MKVVIDGKEYHFVLNAIEDAETRDSYFYLTQKVFGLDFKPWFRSGFFDGSYISYTLFDNGTAVSSVGVVINDFLWNGISKKYVQISTVMTDPVYRMKGLGKWLMEFVIDGWKSKCDTIYLYANDSVVDYYPKYGFVPVDEYRYSLPVIKNCGQYRKLDLSVQCDVDLLVKKHKDSNPFSLLTMEDDVSIMMFHCITFLHDNIYYIEEHDAIIIMEQDDHGIFCYDIYVGGGTGGGAGINDILGTITSVDSCVATLGFTPKSSLGYTVEKANERDTTFFVLGGMENILAENRVTFPFLSRA